ncbi:MAG: alpha-E domain-containing protein [Succinivibrio sp.]
MSYNAISDGKANRLFWLGRYAERAYLSLHFLRRYFDLYLDGSPVDFANYANNLGPEIPEGMSFEQFVSLYIFDKNNPSSIISSLTGANDNAILLREVIKTESLSYIQMSICYLERLKDASADKAVNLCQQITDYMLAFFGSLEERLFEERAIALVRYGRFIESIDLHMRFGYSFATVRDVFENLLRWADIEESVFDKVSLEKFNGLLSEKSYAVNDECYRQNMLSMVNRIVSI